MINTASRETELLHRLGDGEPSAFAVVYRQYYQRIYFFAKTFLPNKEDAEDITADSFVKVWNKRDSFQSMSAISSFLYVTTRNSCFDFLRHLKVKTEKQADLIKQMELQDHSNLQETRDELLSLMKKEVDKMSGRMKQIFHLSYDEGLTPAQIAESLHVSVQTVSNQKTNVLKSLKKALAHYNFFLSMLLLLSSF